jgi:hypothetical protein
MRRVLVSISLIALAACGTKGSSADAPLGTADAPLGAADAGAADAHPPDARGPADAPPVPDAHPTPDARPIPDAEPGGPDAPPPPTVTSVTVAGTASSTEVRQGASFQLVIKGTNLGMVLLGNLGDVSVVSTQMAPTQVTMMGIEPHGEVPGRYDLTLITLDGQQVTVPGAIEVTPIVVAVGGDDNANPGTFDAPLRTVSRGLSTAMAGDHVRVLPGTYQDGEQLEPRVVAGVTLSGSGSDVTSLVARAAATGLQLERGAAVEAMRISGYHNQFGEGTCVHDESSTSSDVSRLTDVVLDDCDGGAAFSRPAELTRVRVSGNMSTGLSLASDQGETPYDLTSIVIDGAQVGVLVTQSARANLDSVTIVGGRGIGLSIAGAAQVTVRHTIIRQLPPAGSLDRGAGVYLQSTGTQLDFGTASDDGQNDFKGGSIAFNDDRAARAGANGPIVTFSATTLNDTQPPAGIVTGPVVSGASYVVNGANNRLQFY